MFGVGLPDSGAEGGQGPGRGGGRGAGGGGGGRGGGEGAGWGGVWGGDTPRRWRGGIEAGAREWAGAGTPSGDAGRRAASPRRLPHGRLGRYRTGVGRCGVVP